MIAPDSEENYITGWIKIYRSVKQHWIFSNAEYFKAWIDVLITVNIVDKKCLIQGTLLECKRGEALMSIQSWAEHFGFGWSQQKVRTFFSLLEKDGMIKTEGLKYTTKLTVCNYDTYQSKQLTDNKLITISKQTDNYLVTTTKEVKELKNDKNKQQVDALFDEIKDFFGYTSEQHHINKWMRINAFLTLLDSDGRFDYFQNQLKYYKLYKKDANEKIHGFETFLDTGWDSENWEKKYKSLQKEAIPKI